MNANELENISIESLEARLSVLETKMEDLYMRPRMPYTQNANSGAVLTLDSDLIPYWDG